MAAERFAPIEKLGRRKLAYTVRKFNDGNYVLMTIDADGPLVAELERRLRVTEPVIKYITVRMDEEEKRLDKVRALRASKKKLSAMPTGRCAGSCARSFHNDSRSCCRRSHARAGC